MSVQGSSAGSVPMKPTTIPGQRFWARNRGRVFRNVGDGNGGSRAKHRGEGGPQHVPNGHVHSHLNVYGVKLGGLGGDGHVNAHGHQHQHLHAHMGGHSDSNSNDCGYAQGHGPRPCENPRIK